MVIINNGIYHQYLWTWNITHQFFTLIQFLYIHIIIYIHVQLLYIQLVTLVSIYNYMYNYVTCYSGYYSLVYIIQYNFYIVTLISIVTIHCCSSPRSTKTQVPAEWLSPVMGDSDVSDVYGVRPGDEYCAYCICTRFYLFYAMYTYCICVYLLCHKKINPKYIDTQINIQTLKE